MFFSIRRVFLRLDISNEVFTPFLEVNETLISSPWIMFSGPKRPILFHKGQFGLLKEADSLFKGSAVTV